MLLPRAELQLLLERRRRRRLSTSIVCCELLWYSDSHTREKQNMKNTRHVCESGLSQSTLPWPAPCNTALVWNWDQVTTYDHTKVTLKKHWPGRFLRRIDFHANRCLNQRFHCTQRNICQEATRLDRLVRIALPDLKAKARDQKSLFHSTLCARSLQAGRALTCRCESKTIQNNPKHNKSYPIYAIATERYCI